MAENFHNYSSKDKICTENLLNCKIYKKSAIDREKLSELFRILWTTIKTHLYIVS